MALHHSILDRRSRHSTRSSFLGPEEGTFGSSLSPVISAGSRTSLGRPLKPQREHFRQLQKPRRSGSRRHISGSSSNGSGNRKVDRSSDHTQSRRSRHVSYTKPYKISETEEAGVIGLFSIEESSCRPVACRGGACTTNSHFRVSADGCRQSSRLLLPDRNERASTLSGSFTKLLATCPPVGEDGDTPPACIPVPKANHGRHQPAFDDSLRLAMEQKGLDRKGTAAAPAAGAICEVRGQGDAVENNLESEEEEEDEEEGEGVIEDENTESTTCEEDLGEGSEVEEEEEEDEAEVAGDGAADCAFHSIERQIKGLQWSLDDPRGPEGSLREEGRVAAGLANQALSTALLGLEDRHKRHGRRVSKEGGGDADRVTMGIDEVDGSREGNILSPRGVSPGAKAASCERSVHLQYDVLPYQHPFVEEVLEGWMCPSELVSELTEPAESICSSHCSSRSSSSHSSSSSNNSRYSRGSGGSRTTNSSSTSTSSSSSRRRKEQNSICARTKSNRNNGSTGGLRESKEANGTVLVVNSQEGNALTLLGEQGAAMLHFGGALEAGASQGELASSLADLRETNPAVCLSECRGHNGGCTNEDGAPLLEEDSPQIVLPAVILVLPASTRGLTQRHVHFSEVHEGSAQQQQQKQQQHQRTIGASQPTGSERGSSATAAARAAVVARRRQEMMGKVEQRWELERGAFEAKERLDERLRTLGLSHGRRIQPGQQQQQLHRHGEEQEAEQHEQQQDGPSSDVLLQQNEFTRKLAGLFSWKSRSSSSSAASPRTSSTSSAAASLSQVAARHWPAGEGPARGGRQDTCDPVLRKEVEADLFLQTEGRQTQGRSAELGRIGVGVKTRTGGTERGFFSSTLRLVHRDNSACKNAGDSGVNEEEGNEREEREEGSGARVLGVSRRAERQRNCLQRGRETEDVLGSQGYNGSGDCVRWRLPLLHLPLDYSSHHKCTCKESGGDLLSRELTDSKGLRCTCRQQESSCLDDVLSEDALLGEVAQWDCAICLEGFAGGEVVVPFSCAHCFHEACIEPWAEQHGTCPCCRSALVTTSGQVERRGHAVRRGRMR
eukprot:TRINITY_DN1320_c0_g1_i1.p1 TRINITY_DN1320_c0_g1~~TRINITY_DN1320_c0_g1_i1.p1  ORF type:complete len:1067 (-),score=179.36 TRINITY_DN1320_c0_g1_i1:802-4002(-)